jgi:hypothetical protein
LSEPLWRVKKSDDASEVGARYERVGANRSGLLIKMERSSSPGWGRTKRWCVGHKRRGNGGYCCFAKVYSWFLAGARDLLNYIFFLFNNRVLGLVVYNTVLENLYENIL